MSNCVFQALRMTFVAERARALQHNFPNTHCEIHVQAIPPPPSGAAPAGFAPGRSVELQLSAI